MKNRRLLMKLKIKGNDRYNWTSAEKGIYKIYGVFEKIGKRNFSDYIEIEQYGISPFEGTGLLKKYIISNKKDLEIAFKRGLPNLIKYNVERMFLC